MTRSLILFVLIPIAVQAITASCWAEGPLSSDELLSIDSELTAHFQRDSATVAIPRESIGSWGQLGELRGRETIVLSDRSLLTGSVSRIDRIGAELRHDVFDPLTIPREKIRGVVIRRPAAQLAFDKLVNRLATESFPQDTLLLENGDSISGSLTDSRAAESKPQESVVVLVNGNPIEVPLARISAVAFRSSAEMDENVAKLQLGLRKGDLLCIDSISERRGLVTLKLTSGVELFSPPDFLWPDVTYLAAHPATATFLSDLPPLSYKHLPQLGWELPLGRNANVLGGRLRGGGSIYPTGLGLPGSARVAYQLDGSFKTLAAELAIDDSAGVRGSVVFRIYGRKLGAAPGTRPELLFASETIRGGEALVPIEVDIDGMGLIVLLVDQADRGDELDYANWLNARLIK